MKELWEKDLGSREAMVWYLDSKILSLVDKSSLSLVDRYQLILLVSVQDSSINSFVIYIFLLCGKVRI